MFATSALVASLLALFASASPVVPRDDGPICSFVFTPSEGTNVAGAANHLTYGFLSRMAKSDGVDGDITYTSGGAARVTSSSENSVSATAGLSVTTLTSDEIVAVFTEQWPGTYMFGIDSPSSGYDYLVESVSC